MKKLILYLTTCFFFTIALFSNLYATNNNLNPQNNKNSILHLKLVNNQPFKVILDNKDYEDTHTTYNIKDLEKGRHLLVIAKLIKQEGTKRTFEIIFKDHIFINDHAEIFAYINQNNKYVVFKEINLKSLNNPQNPYLQEIITQQQQQPNTPPPSYNNNNSPSFPPTTAPNSNNLPAPPLASSYNLMPSSNFENFLETIKNKNFDEERLQITQQVIGNQTQINTEQLQKLLQAFSFEKTKVQTAKYTYPYLTDKQNFYLIYNDLKFNNSVTELTQFVNNFEKKP